MTQEWLANQRPQAIMTESESQKIVTLLVTLTFNMFAMAYYFTAFVMKYKSILNLSLPLLIDHGLSGQSVYNEFQQFVTVIVLMKIIMQISSYVTPTVVTISLSSKIFRKNISILFVIWFFLFIFLFNELGIIKVLFLNNY